MFIRTIVAYAVANQCGYMAGVDYVIEAARGDEVPKASAASILFSRIVFIAVFNIGHQTGGGSGAMCIE